MFTHIHHQNNRACCQDVNLFFWFYMLKYGNVVVFFEWFLRQMLHIILFPNGKDSINFRNAYAFIYCYVQHEVILMIVEDLSR